MTVSPTPPASEPLDLTALSALEQAASSGPWEEHCVQPRMNGVHQWFVRAVGRPGTLHVQGREEDVRLIAALRNAAPALLAELEQTRAAEQAAFAAGVATASMDVAERDRLHGTLAAARAEVDQVRALRGRDVEALRFARLALRSIADVSSRAAVHQAAENAIRHIDGALTDAPPVTAAPSSTAGGEQHG